MIVAIIVNVPTQQVTAEAELQNGHEKSVKSDHPFRPITFPESEEDKDIIIDRFASSFAMPPPSPLMPSPPPPSQLMPSPLPPPENSIVQNDDQRFSASSPSVELQRPTRVAVAATSSSERIPSQYSDVQLDYVRDFSWNLFQVLNQLLFKIYRI